MMFNPDCAKCKATARPRECDPPHGMDKLLHLRLVDHCCASCRYFRIKRQDGTDCAPSECLLLGQTLAMGDMTFCREAGRWHVCDGWKRRPKTWSDVCDRNPHWHDEHISCASAVRIARRAEAAANRNPA